jgi:RNA polymerase sigma-70 factor (ECF subfamily)
VDAFLAAAHDGDFQKLVAVLDSDVVLRGAVGAGRMVEVRGAENVARRSQTFTRMGMLRRPVLVNGAPGAVCVLDGTPFSVMAFTVRGAKIAEIDILRDPEWLSQIDLTALDD